MQQKDFPRDLKAYSRAAPTSGVTWPGGGRKEGEAAAAVCSKSRLRAGELRSIHEDQASNAKKLLPCLPPSCPSFPESLSASLASLLDPRDACSP